jgi:hypothetical protein
MNEIDRSTGCIKIVWLPAAKSHAAWIACGYEDPFHLLG